MSVDVNKIVSWFDIHKGHITYSMTGSRNGADGTADCSGSVVQAIYEAGGKAYSYLYNTESIGAYLKVNGFTKIAANQDWDPKRGDIVLMNWAQGATSMKGSGGAGGHIGVMKDALTFISTDFWTGGQYNTAISEHLWEDYYANNVNAVPALQYVEVWRYTGGETPASDTKVPVSGKVDQILNKGEFFRALPAYRVDEFVYVNGVEQVINYDLAGGKDFDWTNNGIGILSVDVVDKQGNKTKDQKIDVGKYFRFHSDRIKVEDIDPATNGVALGTRYGLVWVSAATLTEVK